MYNIKHFSHTADIRIRIEADQLPDLFLAGLIAMGDILQPGACKDAMPEMATGHTVELQSVDPTALLIDFLSDALTICLSEKCIICGWELEHLDETSLKAKLNGIPVNGFDDDIKAVTYHEAEVRRNPAGNWESYLVFDI